MRQMVSIMLNFLGNFVHRLSEAYAAWRRRKRAYAELASLDDRALADIGITRSEIRYVLSRHADAAKRSSVPAPAEKGLRHAA
jgi:uncharacterized protein YjiS (DUF1127 family)